MLLLIFSLISYFHSFHVSVTEIKYKDEEKVIQISTRIFLDDLEVALRSYSGNEKLDISDPENFDSVNNHLKSYVKEKFQLQNAKGKNMEIAYLGAEVDGDAMWCYLEVLKVKKLTAITVRNKLLHEVWQDQENLVHFRAFDQVQSARLFREKSVKHFRWAK